MSLEDLKLPGKGFTKREREWIEAELIPAIRTVHAIQGRNISISEDDEGQVINAEDCPQCT